MSDPSATSDAIRATPERLANLRAWNLGLTALHAVQAAVVVALASGFAITITSTFPTGPPGTRVPAPESLIEARIGWAICLFLSLAALDHLVTATVGRRLYENDLGRGINRFRWIEYSISATIMVLLISMYSGITSINALIAIAGANIAMILFGWLQERMNPPDRERTTMLPFWFGTIAGIAPWIAIVVNYIGADEIPTFVIGILVAQGLFFFSFGFNQWLQYRKVGPWSDYLFGEKAYLVLSLGAKSVLAWQIYAGSLAT